MTDRGKLVIILNGVSRKKKKFYQQILPGLSEKYTVEVWETKHRDHAIELGRAAVLQNPIGILAAGGDGTLNQVLNGIMWPPTPCLSGRQAGEGLVGRPPIGVIPLGTGNDFARLGKVLSTAESILEKIAHGGKLTDVGKVNCLNEMGEKTFRYFINVASLGMGPDVVRRLFKSDRSLGPTLTYFKAITQTFFSHRPEAVEVTTDQWTWHGKLRVLAIANGQSFGSAMYVAPDAQPDDGVFSTFLAGEIPLLKFLWFLQTIKSRKKIKDDLVRYDTCTRMSLASPAEASAEAGWIETEGELAGMLPAQIEIMPKAIKFFR